MGYESVIGLEIHAQLLTKSKLFCGCSTQFGSIPNSQTCPVCLGFPGVLPVLNHQALEYGLKTAISLNSTIQSLSRFARKNYFYPDLPKAYQISQYDLPIAKGGCVWIDSNGGKRKKIGITRIHLEEDAGKLIHGAGRDAGSSFVDYNRTGVPLMEIVTEPDIRTPEEAKSFLQVLKAILQYLKVCDVNMEEGSLRCDANISVRPCGQEAFGVKTEIKNMNSFKNVQRALEFEIERQIMCIERRETIIQETRLWDADKGISLPMRSKEEAHDYRYFPDPDLLPLNVDTAWIDRLTEQLPELPKARQERFISEYGIPVYDAQVLTATSEIAHYFEECCKIFPKPKIVSNWIMVELLRELNRDNIDICLSPIDAKKLAGLLKMLDDDLISGKIAKTVFSEMYKTGKTSVQIVEEKGLVQITDESELEMSVDRVLKENPGPVEDYRNGKKQVFGFLVGKVMQDSQGKANPRLVNKILNKRLSS